MKKNRATARFFAGLLMVSTIVVGGMAPAQATDTGWNGTIAPTDPPATSTTPTTPTTTDATLTTTDATLTTTTSTGATLTTDTAVSQPSFFDTGWNGT